MKRVLLIVIAAALLLSPATAFWHGIASAIVLGFQQQLLGAGGWVRGVDINADGTRLARTDTNVCYIWNTSSSKWIPLVSQSTMPAANFGYFPQTGTSQVDQTNSLNSGTGCYEAASAPSNSSVIYIVYNAQVFVSTTKGVTFTNTGFNFVTGNTTTGDLMNSNSTNFAANGRKLAIDPVNPDIACVGTDHVGMYCTANGTNAGGATWALVSAVPASTNGAGYNIAFDPATSTGGSTPTIYAFGGGIGGVYQTTTGVGGSWSNTGGPTTVQHMVVSPSGGVVWATDGATDGSNGNLWQFASGTWTEITSAGTHWHSVAVDPANVNRILVGGPGGTIDIGTVSGTSVTWQAPVASPLTPVRTATDVPWLAVTNENFMTNGDMVPDPSLSNTFLFGEGISPWVFSPPSSGTTFNVTSNASGIEQLVTNDAVASCGTPIYGVWDRLLMPLTNLLAYPTMQGAQNGYNYSIQGGWGIDYASTNTSVIVTRANSNTGAAGDMSGSSSNCGASWLPFNSWNASVAASASTVTSGGTGFTEFQVPSTTGLTTWAAGSGSIVLVRPLTGGAALTGLPQGYFYATVVDATHIKIPITFTTAMQATGITYIIVVNTNPLSNYNGGFTITNTASGTGGVIEVTVMDGYDVSTTGYPVCISGVTGTTEANGCWIGTNVGGGGALFTLNSSVFANAYVSGGIADTQSLGGGGYIAAASPNNIIQVFDDDTPKCSTDSGLTWGSPVFPGAPVNALVSTATWAANVATFTTATNTNLVVGQQFFVAGVSVSSYNKLAENGVLYTALAGTGGTTVLATLAGSGISSGTGGVIMPVPGWDANTFDNVRAAAADRVTANTIYVYNYLTGTYVTVNCATPTLQSSTILPQSNANSKLKSVPGNAGHLLFASGPVGSGTSNHPAGTQLEWSNNGGVNWYPVTSTGQVTKEPLAVDAGAIAPGSDYPTVEMVGWVNNVFGVWRSTSHASDWAGCASSACTVTWTFLGDYANGSMAGVSCVTADLTQWNRVFECRGGAGASFGTFNFLLNEDLRLRRRAPANDNDDTPVGLNKAA